MWRRLPLGTICRRACGGTPFLHETRQLIVQVEAELLVRLGTEVQAGQSVSDPPGGRVGFPPGAGLVGHDLPPFVSRSLKHLRDAIITLSLPAMFMPNRVVAGAKFALPVRSRRPSPRVILPHSSSLASLFDLSYNPAPLSFFRVNVVPFLPVSKASARTRAREGTTRAIGRFWAILIFAALRRRWQM